MQGRFFPISHLFSIGIVVLSLILVACGSSTTQHKAVGGLWVTPKNRRIVNTTLLTLQARAYPTLPSDPRIKSVNFTIGVGDPATWYVLCTVTSPIRGTKDTYECQKDLSKFQLAPNLIGVPPGVIQVSFDPRNVNGEINYAPNGIHDLAYVPGYQPIATAGCTGGQIGVSLLDDSGGCVSFTVGYDGLVPQSFKAFSLVMSPEGCCAVTTYNEGGNPGHWDCSQITLPAEWIDHVVAIKVEKHKIPQVCKH